MVRNLNNEAEGDSISSAAPDVGRQGRVQRPAQQQVQQIGQPRRQGVCVARHLPEQQRCSPSSTLDSKPS